MFLFDKFSKIKNQFLIIFIEKVGKAENCFLVMIQF
jgi:hypothetical protein